ncbi:MAG: RNA polymerase sigma factor [Bacteroidales bacterium]|jgi:RNA polymerase sigma-70 factor (ECF subfamily)|nr:RNA polymerase sigma factor [Bacteroidales bacterium]
MERYEDLNTLIERCKKGERQAQKAIFERYKNYALALCQRYAATNSDAEDMLMEGFLKVFQSIQSYQDFSAMELQKQGSFDAWVKTVIINNAINALRRNRIHNGLEIAMPFVEDRFEIETDYVFSEEELIGCIRKLPPFLRSVFNMSVIDELNNDEIADILEIKRGAVKMAIFRARIKVREQLNEILNEKKYKVYGNRQTF